MPTPLRFALLALAAALVLLAPLAARETATFPVSDVRPGMVASGVTVFEGARREPFTAHVLGVLRNAIGPRRHLILARLEGGPLAQTGVIAGMSGSPVFIDGRLVGAVAYSLGQFSREPIAGITPIDEMIELAGTAPAPGAPPAVPRVEALPLDAPLDEQALLADLAARTRGTDRFAERASDLRGDARLAELGLGLRRIATPLSLAGYSEAASAGLGAALGRLGLRAVSGFGGGQAPPDAPAGPLQGGDAVGVSLVGGDLAISATGTVTHVDGGRVYAFGHPLVNLGPVRLPMTRAWVHTVLPSLLDSFKIASPGAVVGTLDQDRSTAIAGTLGAGPRTIPVRVSLRNARGEDRRFAFDVSENQTLTPTLTFFSLLSLFQSFEREAGGATYEVRGEVRVKDHGAFPVHDVFAGDAPGGSAAGYLVTPLALLARSDLQAIEVDGIDLDVTTAEQPRTITIERVWLDQPRVRPGDTVLARVSLRPWRGAAFVRDVPLRVPEQARGTLTLVVGDATRIAPYDQRDLRQAAQANDVRQLMQLFRGLRRNNVLYVRLLSTDAGVSVGGQALTALPPSVLSVVEADRPGAGATSLRQATAGAWDLTLDGAVQGLRQLTFTVEAR